MASSPTTALGEMTINNQQLMRENDAMKDEIAQLKTNNYTLTDENEQLKTEVQLKVGQ